MTHVPEERLEEYRKIRDVRDKLDYLENSYFAQQLNPPYKIRQAKALIQAQMNEMRVS